MTIEQGQRFFQLSCGLEESRGFLFAADDKEYKVNEKLAYAS